MARKKNDNEPEIVSDSLPQEVVKAVEERHNAADEHSALVVGQFGDGLPYSRVHYMAKCQSHLARSAEEAMHAGRCLVVMKEHERHGEWINILDQIGLDRTLAHRMMQAAIKLSNVATSRHLVEAAKSKSKLFELMVLDDEQLEQLGDGDTVMGLALDDIERMSVSQLRAALRESKEQAQAKDQILADKNARIDDLSSQLAKAKRRIKTMAADEAEKELRKEAASVAFGAEVSLTRDLREVCTTMLDFAEQSGTDYRGYLAGMIRHLELKLIDLRQEFDLPDDANPEDFSWMGKEVLDSIES